MFDKSVRLVKKHWAKIGYKFMFSGLMLIIFSFFVRSMFTAFFQKGSMFPGFGMHHGRNMFGMFSNVMLTFGCIFLLVGCGLVIYDYVKNHG